MTNQEIIHLYDSTNISLAMLSRMTGKTIDELKSILLSPNEDENDGQPDWHQEWEDFGETYDSDRY